MNCQCRCGCPIWSSKKSNRNVCQGCEKGKHTLGLEEEVPVVRNGRKPKKMVRCSRCRVPVQVVVIEKRRRVVHDVKYYTDRHEIEGVVVW